MKASTLILVPLMGFALAGLFYSGMLGDSSGKNMITGDLAAAAGEAREVIDGKLDGLSWDYGVVQLSEEELRDFLLASLKAHPAGKKVLAKSNGIGVRVVEGQIELRLLVNAGQMREGLSEEESKMLDRAITTLRMADDVDVDLLLAGTLSAADGALRLPAGDTTLKLSVLQLDLDTWAERIGYDRRKLARLLKFKLPGYKVREARVNEEGVELSIRKL